MLLESDLRRECDPCNDGKGARRKNTYSNAMYIRIPKTEIYELLRNDIQLCTQRTNEEEDSGESLSADSLNLVSSGESDGRFVLDDGQTILQAIMHCIKVRAKGHRSCVMIPFEKASVIGIPGTTLSIRRVIRSLLEYGQDKETTANDIKKSMETLKFICIFNPTLPPPTP